MAGSSASRFSNESPSPIAVVRDHGNGQIQDEAHPSTARIADLVRACFVAVAAAFVAFHVYEPFTSFSLIGIAAILIGGYPIFREALENILERRMTMELSMTIALIAAALIRQFFTALIILLFVLVAEILEGLTVGRGRKAINELLALLPQNANVFRQGRLVETSLAQVAIGDRILVRPGGRIPVDGIVADGSSFVDHSAITGESLPVERTRGDAVYAGTMNQAGSLEILVSRVGADTSFGKIIEIVERAEHSRAPVQKIADQLAGYLVYGALGAAVLTFITTRNVRSTISVIIVAGACGIAAGTPLALLGAIGRCAKAGVIVKGGLYLEQLAKIDTVVLDKTGTLTFGLPRVIGTTRAPGVTEEELLRFATSAERDSEHPLARAIVEYASRSLSMTPSPSTFHYEPGSGISAWVENSIVHVGNARYLADQGVRAPVYALQNGRASVLVARDGRYLGAILVDDQLRDEATQAIEQMTSMNIRTILMTGDTAEPAKRIGRELQMDEVHSDLQPEDKLVAIQKLQRQKRKVAMVGDGINDAPALVQADVGISMGSGTDVARESADVVLIGNNLMKFSYALQVARACRRIIIQNFYGTLLVDSVGITLAALGYLTPPLAAFVHVASELAFILNSARMLPQAGTERTSCQMKPYG